MSDEGSQSYHSRYYEENREEISAKRKQRYRDDPAYREARKKAARERKKKVQAERRKERARLGIKPGTRMKREPMKPKPHILQIGGSDYLVEMVSAGQLAQVLNRKTQTLRVWETKGILPPSLYRDSRGRRLYTRFQATKIKEAYEAARAEHPKYVITRISLTSFPERVGRIWEQWPLGVDVDELTPV